MKSDEVVEIWIDELGSLCLKPETAIFEHIFREAMGVQWNQKQKHLYCSKPRDWNYTDWYKQICSAALRQGIKLKITTNTQFSNIEDELKQEILNASRVGS